MQKLSQKNYYYKVKNTLLLLKETILVRGIGLHTSEEKHMLYPVL